MDTGRDGIHTLSMNHVGIDVLITSNPDDKPYGVRTPFGIMWFSDRKALVRGVKRVLNVSKVSLLSESTARK